MSAAFKIPTATIAATTQASVLGAATGLDPVDRHADEHDDRDRGRLREDGEDRRDRSSETRYGRRKPSRRTNVRRYGTLWPLTLGI